MTQTPKPPLRGLPTTMKKLGDPFVITGIALLVIEHWCTKWLANHSLPVHASDPLRSFVLAIDWITGPGGILLTVGGIVRIVVRFVLVRRFYTAGSIYLLFWLLLASPLVFPGGGDPAPGVALWAGFVYGLFAAMTVATVISYSIASYVRKKSG